MKDLEAAVELCSTAVKKGADQAEAYVISATQNEIRIQDQEIESQRTLSTRGIALRVIKNRGMGIATTTGFDKESLNGMVDSAIELAGLADPDPYNNFYSPAKKYSELEIFSPGIWRMTLEDKARLIADVERIGKEYDPRIKRTDYMAYFDESKDVSIANSLGLGISYMESDYVALAEFIAQEGDSVYASMVSRCGRNPEDLSPEEMGVHCAETALLSLGGKPVPTGKYPVLFGPEAVMHIFITLSQSISGKAAAMHQSFLWNMEGEEIASPLITILDDGLDPKYTGSSPFDDEGVPVETRVIVDKGVLKEFEYDLHSAKKYGRKPTGNGRRQSYGEAPVTIPNSLVLKPGAESQKEIIGKISRGLYITSGMGFAGNPVTGDFSLAASGALIENGEITSPVMEITLAGNLVEMMKSVSAVGNDLTEVGGGIVVPSILIENVSVGGNNN